MFKRKLLALNFHSTDNFNFNDTDEFRNLIVWLEDQKICHYKIENRHKLRKTKAKDWTASFQQYINDLGCSFKLNEEYAVLDWLLGYAVRLEYSENVEKYSECVASAVKKKQTNAPTMVAANPLDNLNFDSEEFRDEVKLLAQLLGIANHPDNLVTLQAVTKVVHDRLSTSAIETSTKKPKQGKPYPLQELDLGFDSGDYVLSQACKILRLLFIQDLRLLQTKINEAIVAVQIVTANPKTDTKLGKVGI